MFCIAEESMSLSHGSGCSGLNTVQRQKRYTVPAIKSLQSNYSVFAKYGDIRHWILFYLVESKFILNLNLSYQVTGALCYPFWVCKYSQNRNRETSTYISHVGKISRVRKGNVSEEGWLSDGEIVLEKWRLWILVLTRAKITTPMFIHFI